MTSRQSIPQIEFANLDNLDASVLETVRRKGCVVIRNVVDDAEAISWRDDLREYVQKNPVNGMPCPLTRVWSRTHHHPIQGSLRKTNSSSNSSTLFSEPLSRVVA